ncbi:hypothetical protein BDY24DRAFT_81446 [Mrakia frigida]|uniref:uncharacterized protein n=1 Tax=Mrakia frigida TaxID=29902 RepID=UPI003FCC1F06
MLGFLPRARSVQLVRLEFGHDCWKTGADIEKEVIPELLNVADSNDPMGFSHLKDGTVVLEVDSEERRDAAEKLVSSLVRTKEKFKVELITYHLSFNSSQTHSYTAHLLLTLLKHPSFSLTGSIISLFVSWFASAVNRRITSRRRRAVRWARSEEGTRSLFRRRHLV